LRDVAPRGRPELLRGKREAELNPREGGGLELEPDQRAVLASGEPAVDQVSCYERDGQKHWLSTMHAPLRNHRGEVTGLIGIARDISERKNARRAARTGSCSLELPRTCDELTQLPKRELLMDRLAQQLAANTRGGAVAVVLIDIDRFRRINVSLGRGAGDELPFSMVSRLRPLLGVDDTLARLSGAATAH
jgi:Diguanylate cyclase, GGDEF domain/PAS fold